MGNGSEKFIKPCPRPNCGGQMELIEEDDCWKCIQCSHEYRTTHQRHRYFELHKDAIINDYENKGEEVTIKVWGISPAGWFKIKQRWGLKKESKKVLLPREDILAHLLKGGKVSIEIRLRIIDSTS